MKTGFLILMVSFVGFSMTYGQDSMRVEPWEEEFFFVDEEVLDSGGVFTFWGIYFGLGSVHLMDTSSSLFQKDLTAILMHSNEVRLLGIADYLLRNPSYIVEIRVHRDCRGSEAASVRYTQRRAMTLVEELVKLGVEKARLVPKGFEESQPYNDNGILLTCEYITGHSKQEAEPMHQKNRRFELKILSKNYVAPVKLNEAKDSNSFLIDAALDSGGTFVSYNFIFEFNSSELRDTNNPQLFALADYMIRNPSYSIRIGVHSDCRASKALSTNLSQARAFTIKEKLIELGIKPQRIVAIGYQGKVPFVDGGSELSCDYIAKYELAKADLLHQKNRRVEFKIIATDFVDD
jgi:outer membrane protein OmpA-like peptidoglycan-associated protein